MKLIGVILDEMTVNHSCHVHIHVAAILIMLMLTLAEIPSVIVVIKCLGHGLLKTSGIGQTHGL